ncbi:MAG TPA: RNA polymerase Rpb4 [Archaeoglobaceae archaeon]|nr:RNA polymerase Rpb4 [Archaeoglobaceae archaeon]
MLKRVKEFEYITIAEAKKIMEKVIEKRKEGSELLFETRRAMNHLRIFSKISAEDALKLVEELEKLPQIGRKDLAVKLVDIMPRIPDEVRTIFAKERFTITAEQIKEILDVIEKYR